MTDVDTLWHATHGAHEQPHEFSYRWAAGTLTDEEQQDTRHADTAAEAFRCLHPDWVSLDDWRQQAWATPAPSEAARVSPQEWPENGDE